MTQDKANRLPCRETGSVAFVGRGFKHLQFTTKQTDFNIDDYFDPADPFALDASYRPCLELGMTLADIDRRVVAGFSLQQIAANDALVMGSLWWLCWPSPARQLAVQLLPSEKLAEAAPKAATPSCNTGWQNTPPSEAGLLDTRNSEAGRQNPDRAPLLASGMFDAWYIHGCPPPPPAARPVVSLVASDPLLPDGVGVPSAGPKSGLQVDFLNFTYSKESDELLDSLKRMLGDDWQDMEKGLYGYLTGARCGHVTLLWSGATAGMGVHVQISGQGCRELEGRCLAANGAALDWRGWFALRVKEGAKFGQTHFAFDDLDGRISIDKITQAFHAGETVTRFNKFAPVAEYGQGQELTAHGFNFGKRSQDTSICCYDKKLEQLSKSKSVDVDDYAAKVAALEQGWTRVELRNRNKRSQALVERIIEQGWSCVSEVLRGYLDIRIPKNDAGTNKMRWEPQPWWADFCAWADKARLIVEGTPKTLQTAMAWVDRQVGAVLAMINTVLPDPVGFLSDVMERGAERFGKRHLNMMSEYLKASQVAIKSASFYPHAPADG